MDFDGLGLPKDKGATDRQDSARLAGIMTVFEWPQVVSCSKYFDGFKYVRHPEEPGYDFSRDQSICLMAGLSKQQFYYIIDKKYVDGKDIFSPSHMGHIARCKGDKATFAQNSWLWMDIYWSCFVKPMGEPNQLLCMMMMADPKYLNFWCKNNKKWKESIREYWSGWRGEPELAEHMILKIEIIIKK
jgi:hypothetical protein